MILNKRFGKTASEGREAVRVVEGQVDCIGVNWSKVCDEAALSEGDRNLLWRNQVLNPFAFEGLADGPLTELADRYGQG